MIRALAIDPANPTVIYAGTEFGGVFKSANGGANWMTINRGLATGYVGAFTDSFGTNVTALAIDPFVPETIYAGTGAGVFKSIDGGESWAAANTGLTNTDVYFGLPDLLVTALALDPAVPTTLYAGTSGGVFKSIDAGASWIGHPLPFVSALAIDPLTTTTIYAAAGAPGAGGVYKSINGGWSWTRSGTGPTAPMSSLVIDPSEPATLYVGGGGLFKSVDGGATWNYWGFNTQINVLAIDHSAPATLYVGTYEGIFKSGATWSPINTGLSNTYVRALALDSRMPGTLYAGTENGGVFKSIDAGENWSAFSDGITNTRVGAVAVAPSDPTTVYAGTRASGFLETGSGVFRSKTSGETWARTSAGMSDKLIAALAIDPSDPATVYCGTTDEGVFKSSDGGASWLPVLSGAGVYSLTIDPSVPTTVYAGAYSDITNGGLNWFAIDNGLSFGAVARGVLSVAIDPSAPDTLYAGIWGGDIFKSTDGGGSWHSVFLGGAFNAIVIDPSASGTVYAGANNGRVFKSTNGGGSWTLVNNGLISLDVRALAVDPSRPRTLYAGTWGGGVFVSRNGGATWGSRRLRTNRLRGR